MSNCKFQLKQVSSEGRIAVLFLFALVGLARAEFDGDPLYEHTVATNGMSFFAVRPFYSHVEDPATKRWHKDYFWPLYTRKGFEGETYSRFLFFGYSQDFSEENDRHHNWVLPFYFQGVDVNGESYFALFPFGGTIHEFLGRDKIKFVLFPIYGTSNVGDVRTTTVLWPIGSKTQGPKVERFRIWPFYGTSSVLNEFDKKFVLWPIYTSVKYTNKRNPGSGFILIPIYGQIKTEQADTYWLIPPFFRYMNSKDQWIVHAPWPFVQLAGGEMKKRIVWPLYGKKSLGTLTREYAFWPLFWNNQTQYEHHIQHRRYALPFVAYQSEVVTKKTKRYEVGDVASRYWKIWPLMSWERKDGISRFRTLELWPLRNTLGVERNWAPWWTLYRRTNTNGEIGHDLLWGLYRQRKSPQNFEWSLLKGFVGYKKTPNNRRYQILFMWFGGEEEP